MTKILVLGASGMLGNAMLRYFASCEGIFVRGTARSVRAIANLPESVRDLVIPGVDAADIDSLLRATAAFKPDVVINCMGLVKQLAEADDPLIALPMNALLPHRLRLIAAAVGARLIHISTDCVFSGRKGNYAESDNPDAADLYGRSKLLGEVTGYADAITLRTSIIGRELASAHGLVDWFLAQDGPVKGYTRAIFSGVPTVELARVVHSYVLPYPSLHGLYHVATKSITKFDLLELVAKAYGHAIDIIPDDRLSIDRSLDASRFDQETGYVPPTWQELIEKMRIFN